MKEKDIFSLGNIPKFDISNLPKIEPLDIAKYISPNIETMRFNPEDSVLFQIKQNQEIEIEIEKLRELNSKKDIEIDNLKLSAKKERKRFWITYAITTNIAIVGIVLGIVI